MMTLTYISAFAIVVGIILMLIPKKYYNHSLYDLRVGGMWITMMSLSFQILIWLGYLAYCLCLTLYNTFIMAASV